MTVTTLKLSSKGQIVIPKQIREELHWQVGATLTLMTNGTSITLKAQAKPSGHDLSDLVGMLQHQGPAIPIEKLCRPVDYNADWTDPKEGR
ncbi:MAG: AbrB/MazE/SpoVT family DNA-binding domain-containing protein [Methylobacter sp.]|nr:AbrB/MazE/SpoVT family DNA-binding domain-containing protein [Methylobacter sp.]